MCIQNPFLGLVHERLNLNAAVVPQRVGDNPLLYPMQCDKNLTKVIQSPISHLQTYSAQALVTLITQTQTASYISHTCLKLSIEKKQSLKAAVTNTKYGVHQIISEGPHVLLKCQRLTKTLFIVKTLFSTHRVASSSRKDNTRQKI